MRRGCTVILLLLLLSSCSFLKSVERINQRQFVRMTLDRAKKDAATHVPDSLPLPLSLYPTIQSLDSDLEKAFEIAYSQAWRSEAIEAAYLSRRHDIVLHYAEEESNEYLNSLLLIGHPAEAHRLLTRHSSNNNIATAAMTCLAEGDTVKAVPLLTSLLKDSSTGIRLSAARHLSLTPSGRDIGLKTLSDISPNQSERLLSKQALRPLTTPAEIKAHSDAVLRLPPSWLREYELLRLRPLLVHAGLWVPLDDVHRALPTKYSTDYPYSMLSDFTREIAMLRAYEAPETPLVPTFIQKENQGTSFRELYGNVQNVNNWAMTYSSGTGPTTTDSTHKPTKAEYQKVINMLRDIFQEKGTRR